MNRIILLIPQSACLMAALAAASCDNHAASPVPEVVVVSGRTIPLDPADAAWQQAPEHVAALLLQDLVEPRLLRPSTPEVRVRAISNGADIAFRLEWPDARKDDLPGAARFADACAVQLPSVIEPNLPAPQMGEPGRPVEITYWSAAWQAAVDGRGDSITDLYPNAAIDHYPFSAASLQPDSTAQHEMTVRYSPARAAGNPVAGPHTSAVQDLIAQGPGTLTAARSGGSKGRGIRTGSGWAVVLVRRLPEGLGGSVRSHVAFAVWEGSRQEAGAVKMRTGWVPLVLQVKP